ncbi:MAG: hypothetical protein ACREQ2_03500 [Candidatus Binatia bacterium]
MNQNFQNDAEDLHQITGGQWNGPVGVHAPSNGSRQHEVMGEYELVEAVLCAAIREYQEFAGLHTRHGERSFREVDRWFWADDHQWYFSFINVCEILNLEPAYIRTGLKMWRERIQQYPDSANQTRRVDRSTVGVEDGVPRRRCKAH